MEAGAATAGASAAACVSVQVQRGRIRARALANHPNRRHGHKAPKSRIPKPKRRNRDVGSFACVRSTARPCGKRMRWLHLRIRMRSTARHALGVSPRRDLTATMSRARRAWRAQWARDTVSAGAHGDHVTHKQWLVTKVAPFAFARACHAVLRAPRLLHTTRTLNTTSMPLPPRRIVCKRLQETSTELRICDTRTNQAHHPAPARQTNVSAARCRTRVRGAAGSGPQAPPCPPIEAWVA